MTGAEIPRPPVHRITWVQLAVLVLASLCLLMTGKVVAYSVFSGGLIAIVPQAYFARHAFRWRGATSAQDIARASYTGEIGKFLLSVAGFALVFHHASANKWPGRFCRLPRDAGYTNHRKLAVA